MRSLDAKEAVLSEKDFHFNVFVHQKWTPYLMMLTLYNSISQLERFRRRGDLPAERQGGDERAAEHRALATMQATGDMPMPRADGAGRLVGRQVQPPVPEQCEHAGREGRDSDAWTCCRSGAWRRSRTRWVANTDVQAGRRSAGEGFGAAVSRRRDPARIHSENSRPDWRRATTASC